MGILQNPPHRVEVTPKIKTEDAYGTTVTNGPKVMVNGTLQPVEFDEADARGVQVDTSYRFITKDPWPGGPYSEVFVLQGPRGTTGKRFDQHGEARGYGTGSARVHRQDVLLTAQGAEVR